MALTPKLAAKLLAALKDADDENAPRGADSVLNFMLSQLRQLDELSNGYPRNPIAANVWTDGASLARVGDELSDELGRRNLTEREELATRIAAGMACRVMSHYPEEIFPRVLRNARCREALGHLADAAQSYGSIVADFDQLGLAELLDGAADDVSDSDVLILESVRVAALRLSELRKEDRVAQLARANRIARFLDRRGSRPT